MSRRGSLAPGREARLRYARASSARALLPISPARLAVIATYTAHKIRNITFLIRSAASERRITLLEVQVVYSFSEILAILHFRFRLDLNVLFLVELRCVTICKMPELAKLGVRTKGDGVRLAFIE